MFSHSQSLKFGSSLRSAAVVLAVWTASGSFSSAADEVTALMDQGIGQIVADEAAERMAKFLELYDIRGLESASAAGRFRSLTSDALQQQLVKSFERRGIVVDGSSTTRLDGALTVTQTKEAVIVVMQCTLSKVGGGDLCTVRVRKVLPVESSGS